MLIAEPYDAVLVGITGSSMIFQLYTIALIIGVTPKSMSEYRWFLLLYTFWDMCFSFMVGIIVIPRMFFPGTGCIIQGLARDAYFALKDSMGQQYGEYIIKFSVMMVVYCVVNIISSQDYCLIYRVTIVLPNQKWHDLLVNKKVVACTIAFGTLLSFLFAIPFFAFMADMKDIPALMKVYNDSYPGTFNDVQSDSVLMWMDKDSMKVGFVMYLIIGGFIVSEIISYLTAFKILKILRQNASSFSSRTYNLHRQLTILLFLQITNPIVFIIFPVSASISAMLFDLKFRRTSGMIGLLWLSLYSISNTILTIGFVQPYRTFTAKYTIEVVKKLPCLKKYQTVTHIVPIDSSTGMSINTHLARNIQR